MPKTSEILELLQQMAMDLGALGPSDDTLGEENQKLNPQPWSGKVAVWKHLDFVKLDGNLITVHGTYTIVQSMLDAFFLDFIHFSPCQTS